MNNKNIQIQKKSKNIYDDIDNGSQIEHIWKRDFTNLMNELKNIGSQLNTIREKVEELKNNKLFIKK